MSVNSKMTTIADKIRALLGLTGTMGLDEMATHLGTEQSNVTAALAAIADKGVTVPEGSNSDSLAALIAAIEAGGGGIGGRKFSTGTVTPAEESSTISCSSYESVLSDFGGTMPTAYYGAYWQEPYTNEGGAKFALQSMEPYAEGSAHYYNSDLGGQFRSAMMQCISLSESLGVKLSTYYQSKFKPGAIYRWLFVESEK